MDGWQTDQAMFGSKWRVIKGVKWVIDHKDSLGSVDPLTSSFFRKFIINQYIKSNNKKNIVLIVEQF